MNARFRKASALFASLVMLSATALVTLTAAPAVAAPNPCQNGCNMGAALNVIGTRGGSANVGGSWELGLQFHVTAPGTVNAISFYEASGELGAGAHPVRLYDLTTSSPVCSPCGTVPAQVSANFYASVFPAVPVLVGHNYVASYGSISAFGYNDSTPPLPFPTNTGTLVGDQGVASLGAGTTAFGTFGNDYGVNVQFFQVPNPVTTVTRIDNTHASVAFADDGAASTTYTITCTPVSGPTVVVGPTVGLTSPQTVTLVANMAYTCVTSATSLGGTGTGSFGPFALLTTPSITSVIPLTSNLTSVTFGPVAAGASYTVTCTPVPPAVGVTVTTPASSSSPISVLGLTNNIPYSCVVTATLAIGLPSSATSAPVGTAGVAIVSGPGCKTTSLTAPTKLSSASEAFPGAVVSWAPAEAEPSSCLSGYLVTPSLGSTAQTPTFVVGHGTTTVIKGLTLGSSYTFTVAAVSGSGVGPQSDPTGPVTIGTPAAAASVHVAHVGKGAVKVAFKAGRNNGAAITKFTATCGGKSTSGKSSPLIVKGLKAGKTYTCTVTATNSRGRGAAARSAAVKA